MRQHSGAFMMLRSHPMNRYSSIFQDDGRNDQHALPYQRTDVDRTSVRKGEAHVQKIHPRVCCRRGTRCGRTDADRCRRPLVRQRLVRLSRLPSGLELALPPSLPELLRPTLLLRREARRLEELQQILLMRRISTIAASWRSPRPPATTRPGFAWFHIGPVPAEQVRFD